MGITKRLNFGNVFIFLFLALFPLGQIIRIGIVQPIDIIIGLAALTAIIKNYKRPDVFKHFNNFLIIAGFTFIISIFIFQIKQVYYGLFYLIRLGAYFYFLIYVLNFINQKSTNRKLLLNSLLGVSAVSAIFGWIQFFMIPDIKPFFTWGWDEHLFRLVGTFLDPTFLGLIIVFGLIITIHQYMIIKDRNYLFITLFLLISLAFTYSRASYLAFIAGVGYLLYSGKKFVYILYSILILVGLIFILPTSKNHSIAFFRLFSAISRVENYKEALTVYKTSPLFGVGLNNMCLARNKYIGFESFSSHACSGSDSSLLLILATTGVVGLMSFITLIIKIGRSLQHNSYFLILISSFVSLLVHSLFSNSLFYPWIMGYIVILLSLSLRTKSEG